MLAHLKSRSLTNMPLEMKIKLAEDKGSLELQLPVEPGGALTLNSHELSDLIRHLAWMRTQILPAYPPVDLTPETLVSNVPAIRWQATEDDVPQQSRLYLLHPGFGWLHIPLNRAAFDNMSAKIRMFLQQSKKLQ
jgi:hypothetical protein